MLFTVVFDAPATSVASVNFGSLNPTNPFALPQGGVPAFPSIDYRVVSGTIRFEGPGTSIVRVPIVGDTADESNEIVPVYLSRAVGATIIDAHKSGIGSIIDDDESSAICTFCLTLGVDIQLILGG
jgi:hypothetical protein